LRLNVHQIEKIYAEFKAKVREIIRVKDQLETKPWSIKEFVVIDLAGVCLTFLCESANLPDL